MVRFQRFWYLQVLLVIPCCLYALSKGLAPTLALSYLSTELGIFLEMQQLGASLRWHIQILLVRLLFWELQ